ncbi:MAG: sugar ABC transporter ATP-binding protein [Solirubrobacterales bacterium]
MSTTLLQVDRLSKSFPGLKALSEVSLRVEAGEIVALVGQNGSGKSTLVKILAGVHQPDPGAEIVLTTDGDGNSTALHFIHQDLGLVGGLSTVENLALGRKLGRGALAPAPMKEEAAHADDLIAGFGLTFDVRAPVDSLTAAERTIVAIARALDGWTHDDNVLVLDEPTASLHGDEVDKLFFAVRRVAERGAGVIFISHRLDEVIELADRVVVLRDGRSIADVRRGHYDHDDLVELIAGRALASAHEVTAVTQGATVLSARGISAGTIAGIDIDLRAGEVVGVAGVLGSGREELAAVLFGAEPCSLSLLEVGGRSVGPLSPRRAIAAGMAYVPADRRRQGAVMTMTARENVTLPRLRPLTRPFGFLDQRAERHEVGRWFGQVELRPPEPERVMDLFSGGNQQKVVLAKWLRNGPKVLLLDEPTQGVDVGSKAGIYELIADAAATGTGVLVCSSDAKELATICHRVLVMRDGRVVAEMERESLSEARLVRAGLEGGRKALQPGANTTSTTEEVSDHA